MDKQLKTFSALKLAFFVSLVVCGSGCASLTSRKQIVKVATDVDQASVHSDGQLLGTAPGFFELRRDSSRKLDLKAEGQTKSVELKTHYRWQDSFGTNLFTGLILGIPVGLIGMGTDLWTGAAWRYEKPEKILFHPGKNLKPLMPESIAIAPPTYRNELASDEIARELHLLLKERYPKTRIVSYEEMLSTHTSYESHHNGFTPVEYRDDLYRELGTTHLALSNVHELDGDLNIEVRIVDVLRDQEIEKLHASIAKRELMSTASDSFWTSARRSVVRFVPNSLGIQTTSGEYYRTGYGDYLSGLGSYRMKRTSQLGLFNSSFSITSSNILYLKTRPMFAFRFRFAPLVTLRSDEFALEYNIGTPSELSRNWRIYQIGAGIGPEIGVDTAIGLFYLNFIPQITGYWVVGPRDYSVLRIPLTAEIGYSFFLSERLNARLAVQSHVYPDEVMSPMILEGAPSADLYSGYPSVYTAISLEYVFPEARKQVKQLLQ